METKIVSGDELFTLAARICAHTFQDAQDPQAFVAAAVLAGDRIACCDEGVVFADDPERGIATIAPQGEMGEGVPTIVGVLVRRSDRGRGCGTALLAAAVRRCLERGFERIRIDAMTKGGMRIIEKLPEELRSRLDVHDFSKSLPF